MRWLEILILIGIVELIFVIVRKCKRGKLRKERGGKWLPDDSKWANHEKFGKHEEYVIILKDPKEYFDSIETDDGKAITAKKFSNYKAVSENYFLEELMITTYGIFVNDEYIDKFYAYTGGTHNSKNVPNGYRFKAPKEEIQMNFCVHCGKPVTKGAQFCTGCGEKLS